MHLILDRFSHSKEHGTFGKLTCGDLTLYTVEQDWENNAPNVSCIPNGEYYLFPYSSPKYGECYIIENESLNVSKYKQEGIRRFGCLIHSANLAEQLQGCIAPGLSLGWLNNKLAVVQSRKALGKLNELLRDSKRPHTILITTSFPEFTEE